MNFEPIFRTFQPKLCQLHVQFVWLPRLQSMLIGVDKKYYIPQKKNNLGASNRKISAAI